MSNTMPAVFFGHGNPMNSLANNSFTQGWAAIGEGIPHPKAILCISAHWYLPKTAVTAMAQPETIHDFGGFPRELFQVQYPAPGDPDLALRVKDMLDPLDVQLDHEWGLDHGTWSVLRKVYPQADIPVIQLSIDSSRPASFHYELGKRLSPLRDEGVLIAGSGNVVHNLRAYNWDGDAVEPYGWALRFDSLVRELLINGDDESLIDYLSLGDDAKMSIPTPDHYLPLLYIAALRRENEPMSFPVDGYDGGSMSMLSVQIG